jgi:carbamoyltransferase
MTSLGIENMLNFVDGEVPICLFPLGFFGHDSAAGIVFDGEVVACAAEERFVRVKHGLNLAGNSLLPQKAIHYCLKTAGVTIEDVDVVAHYCDFTEQRVAERWALLRPFISDEDAAKVKDSYDLTYHAMMSREVVLEQFERMTGHRPKSFIPVTHHIAHAASAFYTSGFNEAVILTLDGAGEVESSLLAIGRQGAVDPMRTTYLPTSLGTLYLILTVFLGFRSLDDEYKVMGLSSYGDPERYRTFFEELIQLEGEGTYSTTSLAQPDFRDRLVQALGQPRRVGEPIVQRHADIAASLQASVERAVLHTLNYARKIIGIDSLCLAGGVALNCAMNGTIARSKLFNKIYIQPASSDEGCSIGAALYATRGPVSYHAVPWTHAYLGPMYAQSDAEEALGRFRDQVVWSCPENLTANAARELQRGKVHAWFQGRMEFGPRSLGNRSILADPSDPSMKDRINLKVKHREPFRPFAPAVLEEEAGEFFDMGILESSPYMVFTVKVLDSVLDRLPAVTHVDGTARVQTVSKETNPLFWSLIDEFKRLSGLPVVLNTSFNVRNKPIVCTPDDAIRCFLSTDIDSMTIDRFFVEKRE